MPRFIPTRDSLRHWPKLLEAALWLVLAVQVLRLLWSLWTPVGAPESTATPALPAQFPALAGHEPFFGSAPAPTSTGVDGWQLFGLRSGDHDGSAILGKDKNPQSAYRVGDELAPGLVLESVASDHVLLLDGGNSRRLELPAPASASARPVPAAQLPGAAPPRPAAAAATSSVDPARLLAQTGLQALKEGNGVAGYTVMPRGDGMLLRQAGLQPGDVLLSINGSTLNPGSLAEIAEELKHNPRAVVEFRRDGQTRTLTLGSGTP